MCRSGGSFDFESRQVNAAKNNNIDYFGEGSMPIQHPKLFDENTTKFKPSSTDTPLEMSLEFDDQFDSLC